MDPELVILSEFAIAMTGNTNRILYYLFPAVSMSLAWGFRGFIGGGPLGAMIPGALVALALCLLLNRHDAACGMVAAFGAVGIGFGGEMTYGQTVGFVRSPDTLLWGLTGLAVKGAVWGLLGGAVLGLGLTGARYSWKQIVTGLSAMLLATYAGWKLVNEPKLIYFSHPTDKPRPEIWVGFLFGSVALLAVLAVPARNRVMGRFALWGALGGGIGFGSGGAVMALGHAYLTDPQIFPLWKMMEYTFGFCFGLALGHATLASNDELGGTAIPGSGVERHAARTGAALLMAAVIIAFVIATEMLLPLRFAYMAAGTVLLVISLRSQVLSWHIALTLTIFALCLDLAEYAAGTRQLLPSTVGWTFAITCGLAIWYVVTGRLREEAGMSPAWAFLLVLWTSFAVSRVKVAIHPWPLQGGGVEWITFAAGTALTALLYRAAISDRTASTSAAA